MRLLYPAMCLMIASGCSTSDSGAANGQIGMPNPASKFCVDQGGRLEMKRGANGTTGYCHLPDGRVVEEWEYFRANNLPAAG